MNEENYLTVGSDSSKSPKIYYTLDFHNVKKEVTLSSYPTDIVKIEEGMDYYCCKVPFTRITVDGKRIPVCRVFRNEDQFLRDYCTNYILLNPGITKNIIMDEIWFLRNHYMEKKIKYKTIENLVDCLLELKDRNALVPCNVIKKYWWIKPECNNKLEIFRNRLKGDTKIHDFITNIIMNPPNYKITNKILSGLINISPNFLNSKLTSEQKATIKSHNKKYNKR